MKPIKEQNKSFVCRWICLKGSLSLKPTEGEGKDSMTEIWGCVAQSTKGVGMQTRPARRI